MKKLIIKKLRKNLKSEIISISLTNNWDILSFISTGNNIEKFIEMTNNWDILSFICEFWFILNLLVLLKYDDVKNINSLIVLFISK